MIFIYLPNTTRLLSITCRAVYSEADLYLLDGPLSAVDPEIEHHLFEECISDLLENSAVVLVTHQLAIAQLSDNVMVMKGVSATYYQYTLSTYLCKQLVFLDTPHSQWKYFCAYCKENGTFPPDVPSIEIPML